MNHPNGLAGVRMLSTNVWQHESNLGEEVLSQATTMITGTRYFIHKTRILHATRSLNTSVHVGAYLLKACYEKMINGYYKCSDLHLRNEHALVACLPEQTP